MHYDGQVYRPPTEANTPLLQVTVGCSYNRCAFCTMYDRTRFRASPMYEIEQDLDELLSVYGSDVERIYLLNGDPFVLSAKKLLSIADAIRERFPRIKTISAYASVRDVLLKTPEDFAALAEAGYGDLYIGLETGYAPALAMIDKGCDVSGERRALGLLAEAGISYIAIVMAGIAGKGRSEESVAATVQLLNGFPPTTIGIMTTSVVPGSKLADLRDSGAYVELTEREILEEELLYLESLEVPDSTFFWAMHTFDLVPLADSMAHRDAMIARLKDVLAHGDPRILDQTLNRGSI